MNTSYRGSSGGGFNLIWSMLIGIVVLYLLFTLARFVFELLYYVSPLLLIATLIIDHKVVVNYGKWVWNMMGRNVLYGVGLVLLTIVAFPVVSLFLFGKALFKRKVKSMQQQFETRTQGEFVEYEEVDPEPKVRIELPPPPVKERAERRRTSGNEYEDLFE